MLRALFQKTGNAVYISHLDLMRLFQRAFKRAELPLTHTQGFNPRPSVSIALPLSLGVESQCELLDFELETDTFSNEDICTRLNQALVEGVHVLSVYAGGGKIKNLAYLDCAVLLEYDTGVPQNAAEQIEALFSREEVTVEKKGKKGVVEQNIIPMIRKISAAPVSGNVVKLEARVCCQNPSLNPMQIGAAIEKYLPAYAPDYAAYSREEILDVQENRFR